MLIQSVLDHRHFAADLIAEFGKDSISTLAVLIQFGATEVGGR